LNREVPTKQYLVKPGAKVRLDRFNPADTSGFGGKKKDGLKEVTALVKMLDPLQELLYAEHKHKVLIVLQSMDTGGKDGTIRRVFEGVNPQGVRVAHFGIPTPEETDHDFLWRVHAQVPERGQMVIFNRSHYEGVLVERVHGLVPKEVWKGRYQEINEFERMLTEEGTTILKFYLHIDRKEQMKRLQERLDDPTKHWKFSADDIHERRFWGEYTKAYQEALERTSTPWAPWYIVPSNHPWFRDLIVSSVIVKTLRDLDMKYPKLGKAKLSLGQ
jgi:PPK2 family polyphosphate:nucleotide phosphotransferase